MLLVTMITDSILRDSFHGQSGTVKSASSTFIFTDTKPTGSEAYQNVLLLKSQPEAALVGRSLAYRG